MPPFLGGSVSTPTGERGEQGQIDQYMRVGLPLTFVEDPLLCPEPEPLTIQQKTPLPRCIHSRF
jgi:hypothetical protein